MRTAGTRLARLIGTPPINPVLFAIGKAAVAVAWALPIIQFFGVPIRRSDAWLLPLVAALVVAGLMVMALASRSLGSSLRVGLPTDATALKTSGIYRFTRHPIYIALFLLSLASCLYCPHPVVIVCAVLGAVVHHRIALGEESFLEKRFGSAWLDHKARVPRYLGLRRR